MTSKVEFVSVVIPTLNEAKTIRETIQTIHKVCQYPKEIIVVDGNSSDGTREIVKSSGVCRLIIEPRRGYGIALRTGISNAKGNIVVIVDGDGTYELGHINTLISTMVKSGASMVLASRMYDPRKAMGFFNFIGNKLITLTFDFFYGQFLTDTQTGFRVISREAFNRVQFQESDMPFSTEILIKFAKEGYSVVEVASSYRFRKGGKTKLRPFKSGIEILTTILKGLIDVNTLRHWFAPSKLSKTKTGWSCKLRGAHAEI